MSFEDMHSITEMLRVRGIAPGHVLHEVNNRLKNALLTAWLLPSVARLHSRD